jgi:hypothetical protein
MNAQQDTMGGMFGPSPEEVNQSLDSQYMQNVKGADITDLIGQMGTRGARQIAGAMGYEDERVAKARLVQEAVKEARENSEPGDIKGMYKNLADSFAKRGLSQQAMQAQMQYRKLEMEDKTFGLKERETAAVESNAQSTSRQAGVAERGATVAESRDAREAEGHKFKMQLDQMTIKEKQIAVAKLEMEMADLQKKQAAIALIPDYYRTQAQQELDKRKAEIQHLIDTGKAALGQAGAAALNAQTQASIAPSTIALHNAQASQANEAVARLQSEQYSAKTISSPLDPGTQVTIYTETKVPKGQKPKMYQVTKREGQPPEIVQIDFDSAQLSSQMAPPTPSLSPAMQEYERRKAERAAKEKK